MISRTRRAASRASMIENGDRLAPDLSANAQAMWPPSSAGNGKRLMDHASARADTTARICRPERGTVNRLMPRRVVSYREDDACDLLDEPSDEREKTGPSVRRNVAVVITTKRVERGSGGGLTGTTFYFFLFSFREVRTAHGHDEQA